MRAGQNSRWESKRKGVLAGPELAGEGLERTWERGHQRETGQPLQPRRQRIASQRTRVEAIVDNVTVRISSIR